MNLPRKPVGSGGVTGGVRSKATSGKPTVRLVSEPARGPNDVQVDSEKSDPDAIAPALSLMNLYDRADSVDGDDDERVPSNSVKQNDRVPRSSLDKPLPRAPDEDPIRHDDSRRKVARPSQRVHSPEISETAASREDVERELGVAGILDLSHTEDTTFHQRQAPAVVHETVYQPVHEIRHEVTEREIHEHEVHHRILPVHEVQVLPARHFVEDSLGTRREVPAHFVPGRSPNYTHRLLTECFKDTLPKHSHNTGQFTARKFSGAEGDYHESVEPTGTLKTERWWVHPPTLEQSKWQEGEAYPVHLD